MLQEPHKTTVCAWLNTVVLQQEHMDGSASVPQQKRAPERGDRKSSYMLKQPGHFTSMKNELGV